MLTRASAVSELGRGTCDIGQWKAFGSVSLLPFASISLLMNADEPQPLPLVVSKGFLGPSWARTLGSDLGFLDCPGVVGLVPLKRPSISCSPRGRLHRVSQRSQPS